MNEASSDAMKTIALASSSERPRRPIGTPATRAALFSGAPLAMLFIGVSMVSTLKPRFLTLISVHKRLGIAILAFTVLRLGVRWGLGAPALPGDLPRIQALAAKLS